MNNKEKAATYKTTINYHGTLFHDSLLLYCYLLLTNHGIVRVWLVCDDIFWFVFAAIIPTSPRTMQSHSTKIQLTRLGVGAPCIHKKGSIPARIIKTLGEKKWLVELLDDKTGKPTGLTKEVKSQMLRRPKPEDNHPLLQADSSSETSIAVDEVRQPESNANNSFTQVRLQDSIEGVELTLVQESQQVLENTNPFTGESGIQESENNEGQPVIHQNTHRRLSKVARATVALLASPFKRRSLSKPSGESLSLSSAASSYEYQVPYKSSDDESNGNGEIPTSSDLDQEEDLVDGNELSNSYNENPASSDIDPDLEMEEELGNYRHEDEGDLEGVNILAMGQAVEQEDDKYKKKWDRYQVEKQALLDEGFSVNCKPATQQGIDIGTRVEERRGQKRKGLVVGDDRVRTQEGAGPCWSVHFDDEATPHRFVPSTALKVVRDTRVFTWKTVKDSSPTNPVVPYKDHGIIGFNFGQFDAAKLDIENDEYDFPFLKLLIYLWPGDWRDQLRNLNIKVESNNAKATRGKKIAHVSENEWWIVWGIIFAACPCHKGGNKLFEKANVRRLTPSVNFGKDGMNSISWHRFKTIKELIHFSFYDHTCPDDPYHPVKLLVDGFNENRREKLATAIKIVLDESMSPFQPRTTKTSKLPNLSFIFRKPKPLGIEKKVSICWLMVFAIFNHLLTCLDRT
jgi:hypothetical protein